MTEINDKAKVQLLFKEFTGVVNAKQPEPFSLESFAFKDYILNNNVLLEDIPATLPSGWRSNQLDASANIPDNSIINLAAIGYPQLSFHKKRDLSSVTFGSFKTWYVDNGSGGSALQNAIPFKQDPGPNNSYNYSVYQKFILPTTSYSPVNMYSNPTFWLFDFKSGFLEFYGDEDDLNGTNTGGGGIDLVQGPPAISFFQYVGATGGAGGGGSGGQSVTIEPWPEPNPQPPSNEINYVIATVDISGNSEMALGYFTLQLGNPYKQVMGFYAGFIENKGAFIKIISCTNEDAFNKYGFKNLTIISYQGTCYLVSTFGCPLSPAGDPDLLKIILVNNNANLDNPTNNPNWILRAQDSDWAPNGPAPHKMPWTVGSPSYPVPALPPALVTVSLLQNGGHPYGVSTQPEYFQNNIVLDTSANILAGENGTGIIDICGGLYVDRDASFNRDVHVRSSVGISGNLNVDGPGNFGGNLFALAGEIIGQGNSVFVNYKHYNDSDFTTSNSASPTTLPHNWCNIAKLDGGGNVKSSATFQIIDKTPGVDVNITFIIGVNEGNNSSFSINVIENNWSNLSSAPLIRNLRIVKVQPGSLSTQEFYLQLDRVSHTGSSPTTDVDIRLYLNTQDANSGGSSADPVNPWILGSGAPPSVTPSYPLEVNLQQSGNGTLCNVITNAYNVNLKGGHFGYNVDMSNNDITNINQLQGGSSNNHVRFQINSLEIKGDTILKLKTNNSSGTINYSNNTLDFQTTNTIDNILNIRGRHDELLTIGNKDDNVLIDGSSVEIRSKSGTPPFGDIVLNNNGGGTGSIIMKNGSVSKGDIQFKASIGFDLSNNTLRVDEIESSTTTKITIKKDLDLSLNDIQNLANLNIIGTNLTIGTLNNRVNFKSMTNMFVDSSSNVSSKLTTVGDLAICNSPVSQKGIVFANSNSLNTAIKKFQVSTGTAIYYSFNDMDHDVTLGLNGGSGANTSYIYYYNSKFLGSASTLNINGPLWSGIGSTANPIIATGSHSGYTLPFWGSLDALLINGFENSLKAGHSSGYKNYKFKLSIGVWAGTSYNTPGVRFIEEYDIDVTGAAMDQTLLNLTDAVFTRDQTMKQSGINLQPSGLPTSPHPPTNWFNSNNEPINWGVIGTSSANLQRIGVVIKLENTSSGAAFPQTIKWENPTMGVQTFLKMDVPWNIP